MLKRGIALIIAVGMVCIGISALAQSETLFERITLLLEEGDESIKYGGVGLGVGMDDADQPEGAVIVEIDPNGGTIVAFYEKDYWIWDFLGADDCVNTLLVLCGRWARLTAGMEDNLYIKVYPDGKEAGKPCILFSSQEDADSFMQSIYENIDS